MTNEQILAVIIAADRELFRQARGKWAGGGNDVYVFFVEDPALVQVETEVCVQWSKNGKWSGNSRTTKYFVVRAEIERIINAGMLIQEKKILLSANEARVVFAVRAARGRLGSESLIVESAGGVAHVQ